MRKGTASVSCSTDWRLQPGPCSRLGLADQVPTTWNAAVSSLRSSGIKSALDKAAISESLTGSPPVPSSGDPPLPDTHSSATRYSPHRYHFSLLNTKYPQPTPDHRGSGFMPISSKKYPILFSDGLHFEEHIAFFK